MKHYALALINNNTKIIDHIAVSNAPLDDDKVGKPQNWEATHELVRFEFENELDGVDNMLRARDALTELELDQTNTIVKKRGMQVSKISAISNISRRSGQL